MGASFTTAQAKLARLWAERLIYTWGPATLNPGPQTNIFNAQNWTNAQQPDTLARLRRIWVTQNPNVQLQWSFDGNSINATSANGYTDANRAGVRVMDVDAPAISRLSMSAANGSGAPIPNFQISYEIEMQKLTVADKLLRGYGLSQFDHEILELLGSDGLDQIRALVDKGTLPKTLDQQIENIFKNRRIGDHNSTGSYHLSAGATTAGTVAIGPAQPANGEFLILEEVAAEQLSGSAPAVTLNFDRDDDLGYMILNGAAFVQADDRAWSPFIPALNSIKMEVSAGVTLSDVPVRVRIGRYKLSNILRVRLGLATHKDDVPGDTYAKVWAGLA